MAKEISVLASDRESAISSLHAIQDRLELTEERCGAFQKRLTSARGELANTNRTLAEVSNVHSAMNPLLALVKSRRRLSANHLLCTTSLSGRSGSLPDVDFHGLPSVTQSIHDRHIDIPTYDRTYAQTHRRRSERFPPHSIPR